MRRRRLISAYLLSPIAAALYLVLLWPLSNGDRLSFLFADLTGAVSMFLLFAMIGFLAEGLLGTPLLWLYRRVGYLRLPWFLFGGTAIGIMVWAFFLLYLWQIFSSASWKYKLMFGVLGCIAPAVLASALFWLLGCSARNNTRLEPTCRE